MDHTSLSELQTSAESNVSHTATATDSPAAMQIDLVGNVLAADLLSALLPLPAAGTLILRAAAGRLLLCAEQLPHLAPR